MTNDLVAKNSDEINISTGLKKKYNENMNVETGYLLIVEDDPDIRALLKTALEFRDYRVVTTNNGRQALDRIQDELPVLVIADIMMPQLDGFGLVHRLRINPETRNIPVIFITATYVESEDREFALRIGATQFIQKPVDIAMFLNVVGDLLKLETHDVIEPLDEFEFYDGYRQRLESKLDQKVKQIAREEHLLEGQFISDEQDILMSLRHAIRERDELILLLEEIHRQLENIDKPQQGPLL
jgi:CheY-like chemotaxis protein